MPADVLRIALPLPLPQLFDYRAPGAAEAVPADVGRRIRVPFGPRQLVGVVAATGPAGTDAPPLREALEWLDEQPLFQGESLATARWLARYLHVPLGEVFATALPAGLRRGDPLPATAAHGRALTAAGAGAVDTLRAGGRPRRLAELLRAGPVADDLLDDAIPGWRAAARGLEERGLVERVALDASALPAAVQPGPTPTAEQADVLAALRATEGFTPVLLEGITGSGKTEVYLQLIAEHCLARDRQALVLVPEIGLTPQMLGRFRARLGVPVHALHSGLSDGERARTWAAAWRGEARVVVGTRSAAFVPLPEAGLIVVDEEHDGSYKQQDGIRYHARDLALVRGKALQVPVLLGSATPSLETLHNARAGRYAHLRLRTRAGAARPPRVRVLDVRKRALHAGLSDELLAAVRGALDADGQVLVFRNRRGYAPVLLCHDCGWSAACPRCSTDERAMPMTVHAGGRRLQCHHCGSRRPVPMACPDCAGLALQPQGVGTERIEELLAARFADVPVLRIDSASTRRRDGLARELAKLGDGPGILVGTQMLAKGHDLPKLVLVCVAGIDEGLFSADFRASEKLAQLLVQVSGRAGRAERPGEVLLQTHHPEHPLLQVLVGGGYRAFADAELGQREAAGFPPFAHMALLRAEAKQAGAAEDFLRVAAAAFNQARDGLPHGQARTLLVSGPVPAPMPRRAGMHRAQLLLCSQARPALHAALDAVVDGLHALPEARRVRWSLDVDPVDLY
ncbi:primosomal protein N' [Luteimonas granuli]|uniref:Replication restart protein PriA n=1 Tax=Luteimonas granuli TaxID=1176533 RepID=A0A518N4N9_9GAMM|nr:primosomal protein N' [Luteimonas granuli]QDW66893.1 primosomal protein N' [Luteimonas granuli]